MNSSTSSSKKGWRRFFRVLLITFGSVGVAGYLFILVVDPYDNLPISFSFQRGPVSSEQRYFHPGLARRSQFDSAIVGSSSIIMLNPAELNPIFNAVFINLGMNAASVFEQEALFSVFVRHHPNPKVVIFGVDHVYYKAINYAKHIGAVKPEHFPEWMYDEDPLNNLPTYNWRSFTHALRQFYLITGLKTYKWRVDGYENLLPGKDQYDIRRARKNIYGTPTPIAKEPVVPPVVLSDDQLRKLDWPSLAHLERMLAKLPEETLKIAFIVPFHFYNQPASGSLEDAKWRAFKRRLARMVCRHPNAFVMDFMIESPLTTRDEHYLDPVHYTADAATIIADAIAAGVIHQENNPNFVFLCDRLDPLGPVTVFGQNNPRE